MIPHRGTNCAICGCCQAQTFDDATPVCLPCREGEPCVYARNRESLPKPTWSFPEPRLVRKVIREEPRGINYPEVRPPESRVRRRRPEERVEPETVPITMAPPARPGRLTAEEKAAVVTELRSGVSVVALAKFCGISKTIIYRIRTRSGAFHKTEPPAPPSMDARDVNLVLNTPGGKVHFSAEGVTEAQATVITDGFYGVLANWPAKEEQL